jgi:hypothetical protein
MKVTENTPDLLVLEDRPWLLAGFIWLMGAACLYAVLTGQTRGLAETLLLIFLGTGSLWVAHRFFPYQRLSFDRRSGRFTRVVARISGRKVTTLPLSDIAGAAVQSNWREGHRMERLVLITQSDRLPLEFGFYCTPRGPLADTINHWIKT